MTKLHIKIYARLGSTVGMGHWSRCAHLATELKKRQHHVYLYSVPEDGLPEDQLKTTADIEIIDDPLNPLELCGPSKKKIALDFYGQSKDEFNLVINIIDRTQTSIKNTSLTKIVIGLDYFILEPDVEKEFSIPEETNLLIVMGGKDIKRSTLPLLKALRDQKFSLTSVVAVLPNDHPDFASCGNILSSWENGELLPTQHSLLPLMRRSKIIMCNGGATAVTAILQNRHCLFFPQTDYEHEFLNIIGINSNLIILPEQQIDPKRVLNGFKECTKLSTRKTLSQPFLIDGQGCKRVADLIENLAQ